MLCLVMISAILGCTTSATIRPSGAPSAPLPGEKEAPAQKDAPIPSRGNNGGESSESAEVPNFKAVFAATPEGEVQQKPTWCWAACVCMVLRSAGYENITQEQIVRASTRKYINQTANLLVIRDELTISPDKKKSLRTTIADPLSVNMTVESIDRGDAIIAATRLKSDVNEPNHAVVIYGYEIRSDQLWLKTFDPEPGRGTEWIEYNKFPWYKTILTSLPPEKTLILVQPAAEKQLSMVHVSEDKLRSVQLMVDYARAHNIDIKNLKVPVVKTWSDQGWVAFNLYDRTVAFKVPCVNLDYTRGVEATFYVTVGSAQNKVSTAGEDNSVGHSSRQVSLRIPPRSTRFVQGSLKTFVAKSDETPFVTVRLIFCRFFSQSSTNSDSIAPSDLKPSSFFDFLGMSFGQSSQRVRDIFGPPDEEDDDPHYSFKTWHYFENNFGVTIDRSTDKIKFIDISGVNTAVYLEHLTKDTKLGVLGLTLGEIRHLLGARGSAGKNDEYTFGAYRPHHQWVNLYFTCPIAQEDDCRNGICSDDDLMCEDLEVLWSSR